MLHYSQYDHCMWLQNTNLHLKRSCVRSKMLFGVGGRMCKAETFCSP